MPISRSSGWSLCVDVGDTDNPIKVRSLARTLVRWKHQIVGWHTADVSNGPTEAVRNLIKRVKRGVFGLTSFRNYRIRSLPYAGKPNWGATGHDRTSVG